MVCKKCNNQVQDGLSFCPYCNAYLKEVDNNEFFSAPTSNSFNNQVNDSQFSSFDSTTYMQSNNNVVNNNQVFSDNQFSNYQQNIVQSNPVNLEQNSQSVGSFEEFEKQLNKNEKSIDLGKVAPYLLVLFLWIAAIVLLFRAGTPNYYFGDNKKVYEDTTPINPTEPNVDQQYMNYQGVSKSGQKKSESSLGVTSIIYDNQYIKKMNITSNNDVFQLISSDSIKQKDGCPEKVRNIENDIINNYGIVAVNMCEMDENFAMELRNVIAYIYNTYPKARNYLTNVTLANVGSNVSYMAAFMPIFTFATSNNSSGYPVGIKTQIILNARYFLDVSKIENSVSYGAKTGYFPVHATRSSAVAHEFGHYLSYVALLNHYKSKSLNFVKASDSKTLYTVYDDFNDGNYSKTLINEAYLKYKSSTSNTLSFDEFRGSISKYAVAKAGDGSYIYDETIAEAFHDCFLNGDKAAIASKLIMQTLESYL